jgi:DedD protein
MDEKRELNDIILNKGASNSGNKKIILAVATLGVILIIVVMLMNTLTSNGTDNLPQAVLPPEPTPKVNTQVEEEPLFEDVEVVQEANSNNSNLDKIAQKLKEESQQEAQAIQEETQDIPEPVVAPKVVKKEQPQAQPKVKTTPSGNYYVQVGSFSKYAPNKNFLKSITDKGFSYKYHTMTKNSKTINKVLVGPFESEKDARSALRVIRSSIEAGAFLIKI